MPEAQSKLKLPEPVDLRINRFEDETSKLARTIDRLETNLIVFVSTLKMDESVTKTVREMIVETCVWCGAEGERGLDYVENATANGYICRSCGHYYRIGV